MQHAVACLQVDDAARQLEVRNRQRVREEVRLKAALAALHTQAIGDAEQVKAAHTALRQLLAEQQPTSGAMPDATEALRPDDHSEQLSCSETAGATHMSKAVCKQAAKQAQQAGAAEQPDQAKQVQAAQHAHRFQTPTTHSWQEQQLLGSQRAVLTQHSQQPQHGSQAQHTEQPQHIQQRVQHQQRQLPVGSQSALQAKQAQQAQQAWQRSQQAKHTQAIQQMWLNQQAQTAQQALKVLYQPQLRPHQPLYAEQAQHAQHIQCLHQAQAQEGSAARVQPATPGMLRHSSATAMPCSARTSSHGLPQLTHLNPLFCGREASPATANPQRSPTAVPHGIADHLSIPGVVHVQQPSRPIRSQELLHTCAAASDQPAAVTAKLARWAAQTTQASAASQIQQTSAAAPAGHQSCSGRRLQQTAQQLASASHSTHTAHQMPKTATGPSHSMPCPTTPYSSVPGATARSCQPAQAPSGGIMLRCLAARAQGHWAGPGQPSTHVQFPTAACKQRNTRHPQGLHCTEQGTPSAMRELGSLQATAAPGHASGEQQANSSAATPAKAVCRELWPHHQHAICQSNSRALETCSTMMIPASTQTSASAANKFAVASNSTLRPDTRKDNLPLPVRDVPAKHPGPVSLY